MTDLTAGLAADVTEVDLVDSSMPYAPISQIIEGGLNFQSIA